MSARLFPWFARAGVCALLALVVGSGCLDSPQNEVSYPAEARATLSRSFEVDGITVRLVRADLAFGPVYFCAATSGSATLCRSALAEVTQVSRIDLLSPAPQPLGTVRGFSGSIRSASYDLGLHWFDTSFAIERSPVARDGSEGHSLLVEGTLARGAEPGVPFRLLLDAVPQYQGQRAVPTSTAEAEVTSETKRLVVAFAPEAWLRQIDFDAVLRTAPRPIVLDAKAPAHDSVLVGLKVARPPEFRWSSSP